MSETRAKANFIVIRDREGKPFLRFDAARDIIEAKPKNGPPILVDLAQYRERTEERKA